MRLPLTVLDEEERVVRDAIAQFAREEILPRRSAMDEAQQMDPTLVRRLFEMELMSMGVPETYDGTGTNFFSTVIAVEEISRVDPAVGLLVDVQSTLIASAILQWGTEEQKRRFLPRLCRDTVGSYALSEASAGSDAFALATRAVPSGSDWILRGTKLWISSAQEAGLFIVFATVDPAAGHRGITAFVVDRGMPGFSVGRKENKLGIRASSTCELVLEDVKVPPENVLGPVGEGYKVAIGTINEGRIGIAAQMLGLAEGAFEASLAYAREREQFGQAIFGFQAVSMRLAEMASRIEAARLLTYNAARLKDAGLPFVKEAAMAKHTVSEVAEWVASQGIELLGGFGFTKDFPLEKYYRDSKVGKIYEGTTFMQLQTIARLL
jgi:alkylation response protein AidB-like acyl-CoA dehydrogenase